MPITIDGTNGISDVRSTTDGSAATPAIRGTDTNTGIFFPAVDTIAFAEGGAEVMRIDSSGNVGIGTSSPVFPLQITGGSGVNSYAHFTNATTGNTASDGLSIGVASGTSEAYIIQRESASLSFYTNALERMRIDSSGNLLVGTTTVYGTGTVQSSGSSDAICGSLGGSNNGYSTFIGRNVSGSTTFYVTGAGQIGAVSTSIAAISDARLKTNIQPIKYGLDTITALKPVMYDFIENDLVQGQPDNLGFIAQDVQSIIPELVTEGKNKAEDETAYLTLKMGDMLPILVKAIQELKATVDAQAARITALENPPVESATNE
jgi:hypothetical protein